MTGAHFTPMGLLAIEPRAFGMFFAMPEPLKTTVRENVALVPVRGPLMQFTDPCFDSYEAIVARVREAVEAGPRAVVLCIRSEGGVVSGSFEAAAEIRSICDKKGVPLIAYVDGQATSAAYALACAAPRIVAPDAAMIGSIGVLAQLTDATAQASMMGLAIRLVASGARKLDGNPAAPLTDGAIAATQSIVDQMAGTFFEHVSRSRPITADEVQAMEARVFVARDAERVGLIDEVATLEQLVASITTGSVSPVQKESPVMSSKAYEEAIATLRKMATSDDPKEAARAKRMLAAELENDDEPDEEATAEGAPPAAPENDEEASAATARAAGQVLAHAGTTERRLAELERHIEASSRREIFASRPDISEAQQKALAGVPLAQVRAILEATPKPAAPKPAAAAVVPATRAEGQGDGTAARLPPAEKAQLDAMMGLSTPSFGVVDVGNKQIFGAAVPKPS